MMDSCPLLEVLLLYSGIISGSGPHTRSTTRFRPQCMSASSPTLPQHVYVVMTAFAEFVGVSYVAGSESGC